MRLRWIALVALAVAAVTAALVVVRADNPTAAPAGAAAPAASPQTSRPGPWADVAGLTEEQKKHVGRIQSEASTRLAPLRAKSMEAQEEFGRLMSAPRIDLERMKPVIRHMVSCQAEVQVITVETRARMQAVLTAEQRAALKARQPAASGGCGSPGAPAAGGCGSSAGASGCGNSGSACGSGSGGCGSSGPASSGGCACGGGPASVPPAKALPAADAAPGRPADSR